MSTKYGRAVCSLNASQRPLEKPHAHTRHVPTREAPVMTGRYCWVAGAEQNAADAPRQMSGWPDMQLWPAADRRLKPKRGQPSSRADEVCRRRHVTRVAYVMAP